MDYWLKLLGGGLRGKLLRDDWTNERDGLLLRAATFARRPGIRRGDAIAYCAAGHRMVFAAGYATNPARLESDDETRWPWRVEVSLPWKTEFVHQGVPLDHLNVDGRDLRTSIRQHSHIRLSRPEYEAAVAALGGEISAVKLPNG
jgi:hypothetical protein